MQEKCVKLSQSISKSEEDRKVQRHQIEELEARLTQLELTRRAIEGDMQRLRLVINERDAENQVISLPLPTRTSTFTAVYI